MPEPYNPIFVIGKLLDVCFYCMKSCVWDSLFFFVEHELFPDGERTFVARHEFRLDFVHELILFYVIIRRLLDAFEALALRNVPEARLAQE